MSATTRGRRALFEEDSYEPASLDEAWTDYRTQHPERNNPDGYAAFRAGFRRGVAQGAVICASTFVHSAPESSVALPAESEL